MFQIVQFMFPLFTCRNVRMPRKIMLLLLLIIIYLCLLGYTVFQHDRQCGINVTQHRVRVTVLPWKSPTKYVCWVCVCSLRHPACKAHTPYYSAICGLTEATKFFHIISQMVQFSEKLFNAKCVSIFSSHFFPKNFSFYEEFSEILT
jgi:hypothetical protein